MNLKSIPVDRLMGLRDRVDAALSATAANPPRKVIKRSGSDQRNHSTQRGRLLVTADAKRLGTAYHESGHAVAAWSLGCDLHWASIVPDGRSKGRLAYDNPCCRIEPNEWPPAGFAADPGDQNAAMMKLIMDYIMILLAGPLAQRRHNPRSHWRVSAGANNWTRSETKELAQMISKDSDIEQVLFFITYIYGDKPSRVYQKYFAQMQMQTEALVERRWHEIDRLAHALVERKTLIADELVAIIKSVSAAA